MINDHGAELLLAAIYRQARDDLEECFQKVILCQKACEKGRLGQFVNDNGLPLAREDEETALWWFSGKNWLPRELAGMIAVLARYKLRCYHCGAAAKKG